MAFKEIQKAFRDWMPEEWLPAKSIWATCAYLIVFIFVTFIAWLSGSSYEEKMMNFTLGLLGGVVGYFMGVLISPYDIQEKEEFSAYTKAVSLFISGYLLGKIDHLVGLLFSPAFFSDKLLAFRFVLFVLSVLGSLVVTFVYRKYVAQDFNAMMKKRDIAIRKITDNKLRLGMTEQQVTEALEALGGTINGRETDSEEYRITKFRISNYIVNFRYGLLDSVSPTSTAATATSTAATATPTAATATPTAATATPTATTGP